jgi:hypothetical protein
LPIRWIVRSLGGMALGVDPKGLFDYRTLLMNQ